MLRKSWDSQDPGRGREMANPSSRSINRLSSRSMVGESMPVRGQPERRASAGERRSLGSDVPLTPRSGSTLHRGSRNSGTAMSRRNGHRTEHAQRVTRHAVHRPPHADRGGEVVPHQRVLLEADTFDNRTLTTTISEKSWRMIMFKIEIRSEYTHIPKGLRA